jgi:prophage regulatory protein
MAAQAQTAPIKILRRKQVEARKGLSRSTIYAKLRQNPKRPRDFDPTFPKPVAIGSKSVGWIESELDSWLTAQVQKSRAPAETPKRKPLSLPAAVATLDAE